MKLVFYDDTKMILFLNNLMISGIDFENPDSLEEYFRSLFLKLSDLYGITIQGYYLIDIYIDPLYGVIIEFEQQEFEYFEYDDNQVDMRICIHQTSILYELEEYIPLEKECYDVIWYHNRWYVKPKQKINDLQLGRLLEHANLYYQKETNQIIRNGIYLEGY